jgi:patatin-like phospholipase/acyl hydrolase
MSYQILSLDGGGIRGVLTSILLERLEKAHPGFLANVDLFAGTSTGGLLALALAAGKTPEEARDLYVKRGEIVFADSLADDIRDLGNAVGAQYSNKGLKDELDNLFGNQKLGDLPKKVLISSFDLDNQSEGDDGPRTWKPKFFHNYPGEDSDAGQQVVDVGIRTAAAPTYFPVYQGYIDGGVVANNPSMCALAQALDPNTGGQKLRDVALLSISTGGFHKFLTTQDGDWGWTQWARPIVDIMLEGNVDVAHYQCSRVLGKQYYRLAPELPEPISMDDIHQIPTLLQIGEKLDLTKTIEWLNRNFKETK